MKKITEEWVTKAEEDYRVSLRLLKFSPPANYSACFHSQQCIEKYLKAILQENDIRFEKIHDLSKLSEQCKTIVSELINHYDDLNQLSVYAVDVRYPGFDVEKEEASQCVEIMKRVRKLIRKYFSL